MGSAKEGFCFLFCADMRREVLERGKCVVVVADERPDDCVKRVWRLVPISAFVAERFML